MTLRERPKKGFRVAQRPISGHLRTSKRTRVTASTSPSLSSIRPPNFKGSESIANGVPCEISRGMMQGTSTLGVLLSTTRERWVPSGRVRSCCSLMRAFRYGFSVPSRRIQAGEDWSGLVPGHLPHVTRPKSADDPIFAFAPLLPPPVECGIQTRYQGGFSPTSFKGRVSFDRVTGSQSRRPINEGKGRIYIAMTPIRRSECGCGGSQGT